MGAFKLGKMTFGSLFKKPETVLYPLQTKPQPKGLKGHIAIDVDNCILCGMCDRSCPTSCISVDKAGKTWTINRYSCIQCGYCVTVCPKKCLMMEPGYAPAATAVASDVFEVPVQDAKPKAKAVDEPQAGDSKQKADAAQAGEAKQEENVKASTVAVESQVERDAVLEAKIAIMEPEKAEKVRAVLAAR